MTVRLAIVAVALGVIGLGVTGFGATGTASAQTPDRSLERSGGAVYAQAGRPRTRIRVTPRCPYRLQTLPYPAPAECDYPGPGFVRQCDAQLVREYRPSGTVIVPVTRCWWERGRG